MVLLCAVVNEHRDMNAPAAAMAMWSSGPAQGKEEIGRRHHLRYETLLITGLHPALHCRACGEWGSLRGIHPPPNRSAESGLFEQWWNRILRNSFRMSSDQIENKVRPA
jgi:hypothetical protein